MLFKYHIHTPKQLLCFPQFNGKLNFVSEICLKSKMYFLYISYGWKIVRAYCKAFLFSKGENYDIQNALCSPESSENELKQHAVNSSIILPQMPRPCERKDFLLHCVTQRLLIEMNTVKGGISFPTFEPHGQYGFPWCWQ